MSMAMSTKMQRVALLASLLLAYAPERAPAQTTSVICQAGTSWMDNAVGQTPCLIAAFLIGQCLPVPSTAVVLPLSNIPGFVDYYAPPQASALAPTDCACNTVLYSLLAACGACQSQGWTAWANWEQNCPQVYVAGFPAKIPPTTRVPEWAYIDITKQGGNFSLVLAQQIAGEDLPDFGDSGNSSSSASAGTLPTLPTSVALPTVGGSATTPVVFPTPTSGSNHLDGNGSKKSNVGPLVGGLVGGIGGLVLIALAVWFFFHRRKRTAAAASSGYNTGNVGEPPASAVPLNGSGDLEKPVGTPTPGGGGYPGSPTGLEYVDHAQQLGYTDHQSLQTPPPMRPYNPDDPSTFPSALFSSPAPTSPVSSPYSPTTSPPPAGAYTPTSYATSTPPPPAGAGVRPNLPELDGAYTPTAYASPSPPPAQQQQQHAGAGAGVRPNVPELEGAYVPTEF